MGRALLLAALLIGCAPQPPPVPPPSAPERAAKVCTPVGARGSPEWSACYQRMLTQYLAMENAERERAAANHRAWLMRRQAEQAAAAARQPTTIYLHTNRFYTPLPPPYVP